MLPNNNANLRGKARKKITPPVKDTGIIDNDNELADDDAHLADSDVFFFDLVQKPVERETSPKYPRQIKRRQVRQCTQQRGRRTAKKHLKICRRKSINHVTKRKNLKRPREFWCPGGLLWRATPATW